MFPFAHFVPFGGRSVPSPPWQTGAARSGVGRSEVAFLARVALQIRVHPCASVVKNSAPLCVPCVLLRRKSHSTAKPGSLCGLLFKSQRRKRVWRMMDGRFAAGWWAHGSRLAESATMGDAGAG